MKFGQVNENQIHNKWRETICVNRSLLMHKAKLRYQVKLGSNNLFGFLAMLLGYQTK